MNIKAFEGKKNVSGAQAASFKAYTSTSGLGISRKGSRMGYHLGVRIGNEIDTSVAIILKCARYVAKYCGRK